MGDLDLYAIYFSMQVREDFSDKQLCKKILDGKFDGVLFFF